jgi:hypothetical protein
MIRSGQLILLAAVLAVATPSFGDIYNDAVGDLHDGTGGGANFTGFTHLDIMSVEITNDATDITFTFMVNGNIATMGGVDWGKYMLAIDTMDSDPGDPVANPWGPRPISMPDGMDYWIGSWADSGGGHQVWNYNDTTPGTWANPQANEGVDLSAAASGKISFTASLAELGLSNGDMFWFDAFSSGGGGGDGAIDALSSATPSVTDWGVHYTTPTVASGGLAKYTVIPEPTTLLLIGLSGLGIGLGLVRRRRK